MDIIKTVTEVNVFFTVLVIPLKSNSLFSDRTQAKERLILISGIIQISKKPSTMLINSIIDPFETTALEILPLIVIRVSIMGMKAFITLHKIFR